MSSPKAAPGAAAPHTIAARAALLSPARAAASRINGAKSSGPKSIEGKARSAQNALKHGFRAQKHVVLPGESAAEFAALEAALMEELAPDGALQAVLARRVVAAAWRLERAERLEAELFAENRLAGRSLGLALIRDCNGARSFDTLLRYRGGTLAELWRALRTLKVLQAEQAAQPEPRVSPEPQADAAPDEQPIEPEARRVPDIAILPPADEPETEDLPDPNDTEDAAPRENPPGRHASVRREQPKEPESSRNPGRTPCATGLLKATAEPRATCRGG
jgi:hypothetical protein